MADLNIACPSCSSVTTISEFVDDSKLICRSCGAKLDRPGPLASAIAGQQKQNAPDGTTPPTTSKLRLAKKEKKYSTPADGDDDAVQAIIDGPATQGQDGPLELRPKIKDNKKHTSHALIAGIVFIILGGIMGYMRYGWVFPENMKTIVLEFRMLSAEYSWIIYLAFHAMIVLKALTENIMQGILCLLVPGYSLFYIFIISDDFYLRAVLAGLLAGVGQDAFLHLNEYAMNIAKSVHHFIASGGGDIR